MAELGTIGQALYMRLFFHFANLYDGRNARGLSFPKRYDDMCREWLGGLTVLQHRSKIIGEQLGPHLAQLIATGFLAGYSVEKAKTREGFVVTLKPGKLFFEDYDRFYRNRKQGDLQFEFHGERRDIAEPLRVAYLFAEKRTGQPVTSIAFVPSKDVETAKQILAEVPFSEMANFISFGLEQASRTNFNVQTLGGLKQYLAPYLTERSKRGAAKAEQKSREAREVSEATLRDRHSEYERGRAADMATLFASLPDSRARGD